MISGIVPIFNNQKTLKRVLDVLCSIDDISEVIAIDDCSRDQSAFVLEKTENPKLKKIFNSKNLGKGGALVEGIKKSQNEILLFCDADISRLRQDHIVDLINKFKSGECGMVIMADESYQGWWNYLMAIISGQRILYRKNILPYLSLIAKSGNGFEQITNFVHRHQKIGWSIAHDIGHILKFQRDNPIMGCLQYLPEAWQLLKTEFFLRFLAKK